VTNPSLESQLASCHPGDLVCCMWIDASIGKTSTNGGIIDVPVRSWGVFVGMFGRRKHIILAQNNFEYADCVCDLDYTAIPMGLIEDVQIIAPHYTPESALRTLVSSFVCGEEGNKKLINRSNRLRTFFQRRLSVHGYPL
jgi:hypothetical protein